MPKPKVVSREIRINNSNNITYVLKKFNNGTYKIFTYQKNMATGCYTLAGPPRTGTCGSSQLIIF
jgi:hypothetical protein